MRSSLRLGAAALAALVLLSGCSSDKPEEEGLIDLETTTTVVDPYAVPEVIDGAYVNKVLARLEEVRAEVRRDVFATKTFTEADKEKFKSIYDEPAESFQIDLYRDEAPLDHPEFKPNPGSSRITVKELVEAHRDCIWARAETDESVNLVSPSGPLGFVDYVLVRTSDSSVNPTHWVLMQAVPVSAGVVTEGSRACG